MSDLNDFRRGDIVSVGERNVGEIIHAAANADGTLELTLRVADRESELTPSALADRAVEDALLDNSRPDSMPAVKDDADDDGDGLDDLDDELDDEPEYEDDAEAK